MPASPRIVVSEAGIVHEQTNASVAPHHFADSGLHGFIAGHVEGLNLKWPLARLGSPSAGAVNLVASPLRAALPWLPRSLKRRR